MKGEKERIGVVRKMTKSVGIYGGVGLSFRVSEGAEVSCRDVWRVIRV